MDLNRARDLQDRAARRPRNKIPGREKVLHRFIDWCEGPDGLAWYVLEHEDHGDGTTSYGLIVGGPYETEGEADDYKRHLDAGNI